MFRRRDVQYKEKAIMLAKVTQYHIMLRSPCNEQLLCSCVVTRIQKSTTITSKLL
jgi:hypothetical protein